MKHVKSADAMAVQLEAWSTRLDALVVEALHGGALPNDPYRVRLDALRARKDALQAKFEHFNDPAGTGGTTAALRADVAEDWAALEAGLADLTR